MPSIQFSQTQETLFMLPQPKVNHNPITTIRLLSSATHSATKPHCTYQLHIDGGANWPITLDKHCLLQSRNIKSYAINGVDKDNMPIKCTGMDLSSLGVRQMAPPSSLNVTAATAPPI
jgi:hypothetical protein